MCIICIELEKDKILPWEASRNLTEMSESLDPEHILEVLDLIRKIENENQICEVCEEQFSACGCQE
tara:strand:+ start:493 stop:690 length:198 start_codon:yes stop_codon:yes gene_type:complete